ncbi:WD40 repeat domain-containing protein [Streptomyces sp. NPDC059897]|uniref:WD40 repeat domain-containing protein n=1 Tax=Streptomyces sp. NPDC059897 TaxID=3346994 RepID=UPI00364AF0ED
MQTDSQIVDTQAAQALLDWATGDTSRLCQVTGARGSGKSQLLAHFLVSSGSTPGTVVHATVPAKGLHVDGLAWELGRQLGYGPQPVHGLVDRVAADPRPLLMLVPDLHLTRDPAAVVADLLDPLLRVPQVRMVVESDDEALFEEAAHVIVLGPGAYEPPRPQSDFASLLATVPRTAHQRPDWANTPRKDRERLLDQAPDQEAILGLLSDPEFLLHGPATAISATLADPNTPAPPSLRAVWALVAPQLSALEHGTTQRAALLHTAALAHDATLANSLHSLAQEHPLHAVWGRCGIPVTALASLAGGTVAAADPLGSLHTLDPSTGHHTGTLPAKPTARPHQMAAARLLLDEQGTLLPTTGDAPVADAIAAYHGQAAFAADPVRPTALGSDPSAATAVIGDDQGAVHVWPLATYQPLPHTTRLHTTPVTATTCLHLTDDKVTLVFSAGMDGTVRLWGLGSEPMSDPIERRPSVATALAATNTPSGPVLAAAWNDAELHLTNVLTGRIRTFPLLQEASALAFTPDGLLMVGGPNITYGLRISPG